MKSVHLLRLLWNRPQEVLGRIEGILDSRLDRFRGRPADYRCSDVSIIAEELRHRCQLEVSTFLQEPALAEIETEVRSRIDSLTPSAPFARIHNGDFRLARMAYAVCRARRPEYIIETGVCYGVTTAFLLKAVEQNAYGELHSIDLPALGRNAEDYIGCLVPNSLRGKWHFHRGTSRAMLPLVLKQIGAVEMFIHDSLHTYRNMNREFRTVTPFLKPGSIVLSDDIESNAAFSDWTRSIQPRYQAVLREESKSGLTGLVALHN